MIVGKMCGKRAPELDDRTLDIEKYLSADALGVIPNTIDWGATQPKSWGMMRNNDLGDCVLAAQGHLVQLWTHNHPEGKMVTVPDSAVVKAYSDVGGYVPGDDSTDRGANMLKALKYWRKTGIGGHKIAAFVKVNPRHHAMVRAAMYLFGGLYAGFDLPISAQTQDVWSVSTGPNAAAGSWGGHAVAMHRLSKPTRACITWGYAQDMTVDFMDRYCDELYAALSPDAFTSGKTITGLDMAALTKDLERVSQ